MKKQQNAVISAEPTKRRWFRFGPGLFVAVLASVAVWAFMPREPNRPKILPSAVSSTPAVASAPDPHWLLRQANALGLTPGQAFKLSRLVSRWDRETESLRNSLQSEAEAFEKGMADRTGKPANVQRVKQAGEPVSFLSRQLADARRAWWSDAARILTPRQRRNAEAAWAAQWTAPQSKRGQR